MEIASLTVRLTDDDAAKLLARVSPNEMPVRDLRVNLTTEGIIVEGVYPTFMMAIPFKTVWLLDVIDGKVRGRLTNLDLSGVSAGPLRGIIMAFAKDEVAKIPGLTMEGETILADVGAALSKEIGTDVKITPREVRHEAGAVVFVA